MQLLLVIGTEHILVARNVAQPPESISVELYEHVMPIRANTTRAQILP
jgi:hypothetical protein